MSGDKRERRGAPSILVGRRFCGECAFRGCAVEVSGGDKGRRSRSTLACPVSRLGSAHLPSRARGGARAVIGGCAVAVAALPATEPARHVTRAPERLRECGCIVKPVGVQLSALAEATTLAGGLVVLLLVSMALASTVASVGLNGFEDLVAFER
eukprot:6199813-Pleurochrysis_carterae.AAC.4